MRFKTKAKRVCKGAEISSANDAIDGAKDILAERYADMPREREAIRNMMLQLKVFRDKEQKHLMKMEYLKTSMLKDEKVAYMPSSLSCGYADVNEKD